MRVLLGTLILAVAVLAGAAAPARAAAIAVGGEGAVAHFPSGITFTLDAAAPAGVKRIELLYTTAGQQTLNLATPAFTPGTHVEVSYLLDLRTNYQPPGIDLDYHWRITDGAGHAVETPTRAVTWQDTRYPWQAVRTDQVTVYTYKGDAAFARTILDTAQQTINKLQAVYDVPHSRPIRIWVYDSSQDFDGAQAPNSESWIAGASYPGLYLVLATIPDGNKSEVGRVIPHEISHQVLYQATQNPFNLPPTWLDEGLAVSNQQGGKDGFPALVRAAADKGKLFSVRALNSSFPYDPADANLAYAESLSIVTFINQHFGEAKMADLIAVYREGVSYDQAIRQGLGISQAELDKEWKASLGYQGDRGPAGGVGSLGDGSSSPLGDATIFGLASGTIFMGVAAVFGVVVGALALRRGHHPPSDVI